MIKNLHANGVIHFEDDIVFAGGCAYSLSLKEMLEYSIGRTLKVASTPDMLGAIGAALCAESGR
ncbi:MAG: hypothetical protein HY754_03540 [Nitrospirae bacterium]|nr:hypothetical protein [Nitrospirota bacterium]